MCVCVCVRERERVRECVYVCLREGECCVYVLIDLCNANFPEATRVFCLSKQVVDLFTLYNAAARYTAAPPGNAY